MWVNNITEKWVGDEEQKTEEQSKLVTTGDSFKDWILNPEIVI
jgi:hypothetical protein